MRTKTATLNATGYILTTGNTILMPAPVSSIVDISLLMNGASINAASKNKKATIQATTAAPTSYFSGMTLWAKITDASLVKGVKFRIEDVVGGVKLTAIQAKYYNTANINVNLDTTGTGSTVATSDATTAYGIKNAAITYKV